MFARSAVRLAPRLNEPLLGNGRPVNSRSPYILTYDTAFFSFRRQNANRSPNSTENNPERMLRNK